MSHLNKPWSRGFVHLELRKDVDGVDVKGYLKEGLAVHRGWKFHGWVITHRASGCCFPGTYRTACEAKEKADWLLCIEGLWDHPLEFFENGLRETDTARVNQILGTHWKPHTISSDVSFVLARKRQLMGATNI